MEITLCKLLPKNARDYAACHIACWRSAYKGILPDDYLENMADDFDERAARLVTSLNDPACEWLFYYAAVDGDMAGRLVMGRSGDEDKPDAGEIVAFYLREEYWGKGLGRQMMRYSLDKLTELGYHEAVLWVLEENARARRFYEKAGFAFDGTKKEITVGKPLVEVRYVMIL